MHKSHKLVLQFQSESILSSNNSFYEILSISMLNISKDNPSLNCASLVPGQSICISSVSTNQITPSPASTCYSYSINYGDTCWSLINTYSISNPNLFYQLNPNVNCNNLQIGQTICLPSSTGSGGGTLTGCTGTYTVVAGDYCYTIANRLGIAVSRLYACNPSAINSDCTNLQISQVLRY